MRRSASTGAKALREAAQLRIQGLDGSLCILFLCSWAEALLSQNRVTPGDQAEATPLLHRADALVAPSTPPEIVARLRRAEASLSTADGRSRQAEKILRDTMTTVPAHSPRRKYIVRDLSALLASRGQLAHIEREFSQLATVCSSSFPEEALMRLRFINAVETGQVAVATELRVGLDRRRGNTGTHQIDELCRVLDLMVSPRTHTEHPTDAASSQDESDSDLVVQCLLTDNIHQALRWARLCERRIPTTLAGCGFMSLNLIRAELADGNTDAAERLLELRLGRGNESCMDAFFLSRLSLLRGDRSTAIEYLALLLDSVDRCTAQGRLEFELRLSSELSRDVVFLLTRSAEHARAKRRSQPMRGQKASTAMRDESHRLIGISSALTTVRNQITVYAQSDLPVLLTGETGTGKEVAARTIHETGPRSHRPFLVVNCGAISESLLESELFGHEKGAFSGAAGAHKGLFEEADDGTILLDEIGEISPHLQTALLRVLEMAEIRPTGSSKARHIKCRIVAATNADLWTAERKGKFRRDLLFRLQRLELHMPPLRERPEDIVPLAMYFLNEGRTGESTAVMSPRLRARMQLYAWPGNVRELKNVVERARLMNSDKPFYDTNDVDFPGAAVSQPAASDPNAIASATSVPIPGGIAVPFSGGQSRVRRRERLRILFSQHRLLTRAEVVATLGISPNTASTDLKALAAQGVIERVQPTASPRSTYFVSRETGKQ